jgi:hypothetical protein
MEVSLTKYTKKYKLSKLDLIRSQLLISLYLVKKTKISLVELDLLSFLSQYKSIELSEFCKVMAEILYGNITGPKTQTIRNKVSKLQKLGFIERNKVNKYNISISKEIGVIIDSNSLIDYQFLNIETV